MRPGSPGRIHILGICIIACTTKIVGGMGMKRAFGIMLTMLLLFGMFPINAEAVELDVAGKGAVVRADPYIHAASPTHLMVQMKWVLESLKK